MPYWQIKDRVLYKGEKAIIPFSLRSEMKDKLRAAHLSYDSMIRRTRTTAFWSGIQHEEKQVVDCCETCQRYNSGNQRETLRPHDFGNFPREKVGADLCKLYVKHYLVVVDYYSTYIKIDSLSFITAANIIKKMKNMFARWGLPRQLVTECGSQFLYVEFQNFLKNWEIDHSTPPSKQWKS